MTLDERMRRLERDLARAKRRNVAIVAALVVAVAAVVWFVAGPARAAGEKVVRASKFEVVDEKDNVRVAVTVTRGGPSLQLFDERGKCRAGLGALEDVPSLTLFDEKGEMRVVLGVPTKGPLLRLSDEKGAHVLLGARSDGTYLLVCDKNGKVLWGAP